MGIFDRLRRLTEAGKRNSKKDQDRLQMAHDNLVEAGAICHSGMSEALAEAARSHNETYTALSQAVSAHCRATYERYGYLVDMYDDALIYSIYDYETSKRTLYKASYSIDDSDRVVISNPEEVVQPAPTLESQRPEPGELSLQESCVPLVERAVRSDGTIKVKVIAPGWGSSGYYPADVLERDGPKAFPKGTKMYWNHPTDSELAERPEGDLDSLAAVLESPATWDANGTAGAGLYADAKVFTAYQGPLDEMAPHIGNSIRVPKAMGRWGQAEGREGRIIEELLPNRFNTVDFVTEAGAGGEIVSLFEAARQQQRGGASFLPSPATQEVSTMAMTEEEAKALRESYAAQQTEIARLRESMLLSEARGFVVEQLSGIDLPDPTRQRLTESLSRSPAVKDGALDREAFQAKIAESVKSELDYLAKTTGYGSGQVRGMGASESAGETSSAPLSDEAIESQLAESFRGLGLNDSTAKIAAQGRR